MTIRPLATPSGRWPLSWLCLLAILLLPACASLPPVVSGLSWAISGISYIATSKGPSDHAISIVMKKDCTLLRMLRFQPICVERTERTNQSLLAKLRERPWKKEPDPLPPDLVVINH